MKSVLSDEFRCLHHVIHLYARNVQDFVTEAQRSANNKAYTPLLMEAASEAEAKESLSAVDGSPIASTAAEDPLLGLCSYYFELEGVPDAAVEAEGEQKSNNKNQAVLYRSEVCSGTQHPTWAPLPATLRAQHGAHTSLQVKLHQVVVRQQQGNPNEVTPVLLGRIVLSFPTLLYLGDCVTTAEAQLAQLQQRQQRVAAAKGGEVAPGDSRTVSTFALLLRCVDGVFAVPSAFFATATAAGVPRPTATWYTAEPALKGAGVTIGDLQTWALTSRAWAHYRTCLSSQQEAQRQAVETAAAAERTAAQPALHRALRDAQLAEAKAALAAEEAELERLRQQVAEAQAVRDRQAEQLTAVAATTTTTTIASTAAEDKQRRTQEQRALGAIESAAWVERRRLVRELSLLFPVELAERGSYNSAACRIARRAKDSIRGALLPAGAIGTRAGGDSPWAATTADEMAEEAAALGYATEVIAALAVVHDCALPYPLVFAGPRSRVLAVPALSPAQAAAAVTGPNDVKLPLYCLRAAERPTMLAAVRLLLLDAAAVAQEMGKRSEVMACGQRIGAVLHELLADGHC